MSLQWAFSLILTTFSFATSQEKTGCPIYGCRPSGSFSLQQSVPMKNPGVSWENDFFIGPVPNAHGCVGNAVQLICPSNGPAGDDTGYMSVSADNGAVRWRDPVLRFPSLPLLGISGDVIGSDGSNLVHYDKDGKLVASVVNLEPNMHPIFSPQLVGENFILLVSKAGQIALRDTAGRPIAELFLNGTVERDNGLFIPVASPVSNDNRFYLLTEFVPEYDQIRRPSILGLQRLYAIDVFDRMTDRVKIAWYVNFEREEPSTNNKENMRTKVLRFRPKLWRRRLVGRLRNQPELPEPSLLFDEVNSMIYVSLPPPELGIGASAMTTFWGLKDNGPNSDVIFRSYRTVTNMVLFEVGSTHSEVDIADSVEEKRPISKTTFSRQHYESNVERPLPNQDVPYAGSQLWVSLDDGKLCAVEKDGNISKILDLPAMLKTDVQITSKIVTVRNNTYGEDILILGIKIMNSTAEFKIFLRSHNVTQTNATAFLIAIDTPENADDSQFPVVWLSPTPDNSIVTGQIVGVPGNDIKPDRLIYFAQKEGQYSRIVSIV